MRPRRTLLLVISLLLLPASMPAQEEVPYTDSVSGLEKPRIEVPASPQSTADPWLFDGGNRIEIDPPNVAALMLEDALREGPGPERSGVVLALEVSSDRFGRWTRMENGGRLWTASVSAPEAQAVRLRFRPWSPPEGAVLTVYDGADGTRAFSTHSDPPLGWSTRSEGYLTRILLFEELRLEYYLPPGIDERAPEAQLVLDGLIYIYRGFAKEDNGIDEVSCHLDVMCYPDWVNEKDGVGATSWTSNQYYFRCSGSLLNRNPVDFTPVFLTAEHCNITNANVDTLLVAWHYETDQCNGTPANELLLEQTPGVAALVNDPSTDLALVGLAYDHIDASLLHLGWDAAYLSNSSAVTGIHHPDDSHKRISFGTKTGDNIASCDTNSAYRVSWPLNNGLTEGGSSGSPLFGPSKRVRAVLTGCGPESCSSANWDDYGRFDMAWAELQPWLQPTDPVYVDASYSGTETGTISQPFDTVAEGYFAVQEDSHVYIEAGSYGETFNLEKAMTLHAENGTVVIGQ